MRLEDPDVVFLMETRIRSRKVDDVRRITKFKNGLCVDPCGKKGGLALFWKDEVDLRIF